MLLKSEIQDRIHVLTLNRPEKRNSLHPDLISGLSEALEATDADGQVRVVILTGAGSSFCAGLDLTHMVSLGEEDRVDYMESAFSLFRQVYELRQPVIAAVNGPAMAGGFDLAAFCDLRICGTEAKFAQTEILLGLTQVMYPLYEVIGLGRAKELALTGKPISAEEAHRIGFVSAVHPNGEVLSAARELAKELAGRPPEALFETKRLGRELIAMHFDQAFRKMFDVICARLRSEEHRAAVEDYLRGLKRRKRADPAAS